MKACLICGGPTYRLGLHTIDMFSCFSPISHGNSHTVKNSHSLHHKKGSLARDVRLAQSISTFRTLPFCGAVLVSYTTLVYIEAVKDFGQNLYKTCFPPI